MKSLALVLAVSALAAGALIGCAHDDGMSAEQRQMAKNVGDWAKKSDGKWENLSQDQKDALIKSTGSEATAKQVLEMKAHPPAPVQGGPPSGWKPGQAPSPPKDGN